MTEMGAMEAIKVLVLCFSKQRRAKSNLECDKKPIET